MTERGMSTEGCPVMGPAILAAASNKSSGSGYIFLVAIVALFGLLYFVTIRPQRNRQRAAAQTKSHLRPGMRVRTPAAMYSTVAAGGDRDGSLEVARGVKVRYLSRAILDVVSDNGQMEAGEPEPAEPETLDEDGAAPRG